MAQAATSKHLGSSMELTAIMPIKQGLINIPETVSYATRLKLLLKTLNEIRKTGTEANWVKALTGPVERLQTINFIRWLILDNNSLLLAVSFDRPWEPYIRKIVVEAGSLLDVILCHCENYEAHSTDLGYPAFAQWVRTHQVDCEYFYSATPDVTIEDIQYLKALEQKQLAEPNLGHFDVDATRLRVPNHQNQSIRDRVNTHPQETLDQALGILSALYVLTAFFPKSTDGSKDWKFLHRTAHAILPPSDFDIILRLQPNPQEIRKKYKPILAWFENKVDEDPKSQPKSHGSQKNEIQDTIKKNLQGNILTPYRGMTHGCLLLMRLLEPKETAYKFLTNLKPTADGENTEITVNVAFTYQGLKKLGMPEKELKKFPQAFREGMEARAGLLGDMGWNHPNNWKLPRRNGLLYNEDKTTDDGTIRLSTVDLVIELQTKAEDVRNDHRWSEDHPLYEYVKDLVGHGGVQLLSVQPLRRFKDSTTGKVRGHFGFKDNISQPAYHGKAPHRDRVPLGELLLGHENAHGDEIPEDLGAILENGTFLVVRKLNQQVDAFTGFLNQHKETIDPETLKAKMMGRYADGTPLVKHHDLNEFDYQNDQHGEQCPLQAHIRRANPRTNNHADGQIPAPRITRRGFSYGPSVETASKDERGLLFMAYNANIAEQFEVIQRWISGGNSTGIASAHSDPLLGLPMPGEKRTLRFIHDGKVMRFPMNDENTTPFVTLDWGMYLFVPSISALQKLARYLVGDTPPTQDDLVHQGKKIIHKLQALATRLSEDQVIQKWKELLEDLGARQSGATEALWAAVCNEYNGVLKTPYGVLVGSEPQVMEVFHNDKAFSVRAYWNRMNHSLGQGYLGMDPEPQEIEASAGEEAKAFDQLYRRSVKCGQHGKESQDANPLIAGISEQKAFELAINSTTLRLDAAVAKSLDGTRNRISLRHLAVNVFADLCKHWFGFPQDPELPKGYQSMESFQAAARYIFSPNPSDLVENQAKHLGDKVLSEMEAYVAETRTYLKEQHGAISGPLFQKITDNKQLARTLTGLIQGFIAPTLGNFLSIMHNLCETEELWRLQQSWFLQRPQQANLIDLAEEVIRPAIIKYMRYPNLLHRTAVKDLKLGGVDIRSGDRVVLGLVSATREAQDKREIFFGGHYGKGAKAPVHACPGQPMAFGVLLGMISAVLEAGTLEPEPTPLTISIKK